MLFTSIEERNSLLTEKKKSDDETKYQRTSDVQTILNSRYYAKCMKKFTFVTRLKTQNKTPASNNKYFNS